MQKILIIGCGLIGFSFARAIKKGSMKVKISVYDHDENVLENALSSGIADQKYDFGSKKSFDLVVICTPLSTYEDIFAKIDKNITDSLVIDLGSLNSYPLSLKNDIISCHPIAGSEKSGILNSDEDLFQGKDFVVSYENEDIWFKNKDLIADLVKNIGSKLKIMDADEHDRIYALVSHLPQFLSFLTADMIPNFHNSEILKKSFRLSSSDPAIWADIFDINANNIEEYYAEFFDNLCGFIEDIDNKNCAKISKKLAKNHFLYEKSDFKREEFSDFEFSKSDISKLLFRLIIVLSYVRIKDVRQDFDYAGPGFKDFVSIISFFDCFSDKELEDLFTKHRKTIVEDFDKISI